ncbi:MAG: M56 family metallopeptidase, partial [Steroidobacteraceae bacterium]
MIDILVQAAVRSSLLIIVGGLVLAFGRLRSPHVEKAVWTVLTAASLGMPLLLQIRVAPILPAPLAQVIVGPFAAASGRAAALHALWTVIYLVPAVLLMLRFVWGWTRMRRIRCEAQPVHAPWAAGLDVRASASVSSPVTFGKSILLPAEFATWSAMKLAAAVAHERAHVIHRDCYVLWLARLARCAYWFNPLAWWIARRLGVLAERTSDEAAVECLGSRTDYAELLLQFQASRQSALAVAIVRSSLSSRIERILSGDTLSPALNRWQLALVLTAILPAVALAAMPVGGTASAGSQHPRVVSWGALAAYYPQEAIHKGVGEGVVKLAVTLNPAGEPTHAKV